MSDDFLTKDKKQPDLSEEVAELLMDDFAKKNNIKSPLSKDSSEKSVDSVDLAAAKTSQTPSMDKLKNINPSENQVNDDINDETLPYEFSVDIPPRKRDSSLSIATLMSGDNVREKVELRAPAGTSFEVLAMELEGEEVVDEYVDYEDFSEIDEVPQVKSESEGFETVLPDTDFDDDAIEDNESDTEEDVNDNANSFNMSVRYINSVEDKTDELSSQQEVKKPRDLRINENILETICESKLEHIARQKAIVPESRLRDSLYSVPAPRGFLSAINAKLAAGENALIAEVKKASPSKGIIRGDFDPGQIAKAYEAGGATCVSVLTDTPYFQGRDEYLNIVSRSCRLPILRKDFMLDSYQVVESRALGADCILLIMAALSLEQAMELEDVAMALGMDVLLEVHDEKELEQALKLRSMLIGINNRDLKTLKVDLAVTERLAPMVPFPNTVVCESAIYSYHDILRMNEARVKAFLVGESLMLEDNIQLATERLLGNTV